MSVTPFATVLDAARTRHGAASRRVGPDGYARSAVRQLRKSAGLLVGEVPA